MADLKYYLRILKDLNTRLDALEASGAVNASDLADLIDEVDSFISWVTGWINDFAYVATYVRNLWKSYSAAWNYTLPWE